MSRLSETEKLLRENLFGENVATFELISEGIYEILINARERLIDAETLIQNKRYNVADFLNGTVREEIGKLFILSDMCRLDFRRHNGVLSNLCRAYYSHVKKFAYFEMSSESYPGIHNLREAKRFFEYDTKHKWESDPESGEPEMPHESVFYRDMNLYVDFSDYSQCWIGPQQSPQEMKYEAMPFMGTPMDKIKKTVETLLGEYELGVFSPGVLKTLNRHFSPILFTEKSTTKQLIKRYEKVAEEVCPDLGIDKEQFRNFKLYNWPLYSFV